MPLYPDYNTFTRSGIVFMKLLSIFKNGKCFTKHVQPFAITVDTNYRNKKPEKFNLLSHAIA